MKIKFCPKCRKTDIVMVAGGNIGVWKCKKCGFQSAVFPSKEIEKK
jgi:ribosomal protein L37AE/L43A